MAVNKKNKIRRSHSWTFFVAALLIIVATIISYTGIMVPEPGGDVVPLYGSKDMRLGIDIRGGVEAIFAPKDYDGVPSEEQLRSVVSIMEKRLDNLSIYDRDVISVPQSGRVIVRFPWKSSDDSFNPEAALAELGATAQLSFKEDNGDVVITGKDVKRAYPEVVNRNNENVVGLELTDEGARLFEEATGRLVGKKIGIYMDSSLLSNPVVQTKISGGRATITGMQNAEEAVKLADQINAGALPFAIEPISSSAISPSLGSNALNVMVKAGLVSFLVLCIFLIAYYRLAGFVACFALLAQVVGILLAISIPQQTLTLQGIAGIILSIGMGVDANIIIAERIKEEMRTGAGCRLAINSGFDNAFSSILDGNVTVAISAICLMIFGTGSMLSFGYSLLAGVILNLFCGAFLSNTMMRSLAEFDILRKPSLYNASEKQVERERKLKEGKTSDIEKAFAVIPLKKFDFYKNRYKSLVLSVILLVVGFASLLIFKANLDIQFSGGSIITYSVNNADLIDEEKAADVAEEKLGMLVTAQKTRSVSTEENSLVINVAGNNALTPEQQANLKEALQTAFPDAALEVADANVVEPFIGRETLINGLYALLIASVLIVLYVWVRFRTISGPSAGIFSLAALLHDVLLAFFVFIVFRMAINDTVLAVVLSILGWSVNDTIVIFDRIRENARLYGRDLSLDRVVELSIHQCLGRSINTSLCSFIAVFIAYVFALIYGISSIQQFALPMMVGLIVGSYSSIFLATPFWASWKLKQNKRTIEKVVEKKK